MKIRRYIGKSSHEAILKVKMDLGSEAVILNTRKVRQKGFLKLFSKPLVEVLAAVDEFTKDTTPQKSNIKDTKKIENKEVKNEEVKKDDKIYELENKVNSMELLLKKVYDHLQGPNSKSTSQEQENNKQKRTNIIELFYNNLIKNEVDAEVAKQIMDSVAKKVGDTPNVNDTASVLYNLISAMLGKPKTLEKVDKQGPTVILFIGPTGVGKTTTLAKIAANYSLNHKKSVGLITADTYRIAAVEQLKTYAEILGMPIKVVYSPNEINDVIAQYNDKDFVLIDTAGRSTRNKTQFDELKTLVNSCNADEIYLVLSTTTSVKNCKDIIKNYDFLKEYKLIFTKLDEAPVTGVILNVKCMTKKSLSYVTTGQSVPDDIEVANVEKLTKNFLGSIS